MTATADFVLNCQSLKQLPVELEVLVIVSCQPLAAQAGLVLLLT